MRLIVDGTAGLVTVDDAEDLKALNPQPAPNQES
jgi:hypothetical protein